jgi:hypothetical protein
MITYFSRMSVPFETAVFLDSRLRGNDENDLGGFTTNPGSVQPR